MKKYLLPLLLLIASPAAAEEEISTEQWCTAIEELATTVLTAKYLGVGMSEAMSRSDLDLYRYIVLDAYKQPDWVSSENQDRQILEFSNKWALACYEVNL